MLQRIDSILVSGGGVFLIKGTGEVADLLVTDFLAHNKAAKRAVLGVPSRIPARYRSAFR